MTASPAPTTQVLMVCTGNICRSPAAHLLLDDQLGPASGVTVSSAGVMAPVGERVSGPMQVLLRRAGVDTSGFRASFLTAADVRRATLVLGATRAHRSAAVSLWPAAVRRSYTLKEFARLVQRVAPEQLETATGSATPGARLATLAELAARHRSPVPAEEDDIADPIGQSDEVYAEVFGEIRSAVDTILRVIRG